MIHHWFNAKCESRRVSLAAYTKIFTSRSLKAENSLERSCPKLNYKSNNDQQDVVLSTSTVLLEWAGNLRHRKEHLAQSTWNIKSLKAGLFLLLFLILTDEMKNKIYGKSGRIILVIIISCFLSIGNTYWIVNVLIFVGILHFIIFSHLKKYTCIFILIKKGLKEAKKKNQPIFSVLTYWTKFHATIKKWSLWCFIKFDIE